MSKNKFETQPRDLPVNVCTSTMPAFALDDCLTLAAKSGFQGVELRVHDSHHVSLRDLCQRCDEIKRRIESHNLKLSLYNSYYGVQNEDAIDALIHVSRRSGVRYFRVTLPLAGKAEVRTRAFDCAVIPSYEHGANPREMLGNVKTSLQRLARKAKAASVCALVELHWGTIMSSFSSAHYLLGELDPDAVAITLDPANMIIEGKEDWEYGIYLLRDHIANVHIKNVSWVRERSEWKWKWDGLANGMVDWSQLLSLLARSGYTGMFALEDFRVPSNFDGAFAHLQRLRQETCSMMCQSGRCEAA